MTAQAKAAKQVEPIDSDYFSEEDLMDLQSRLIKDDYIDKTPREKDPLMDPAFLAKALDRLIDMIIADIIQYPDEMLFGTCDGNHRRDFERSIRFVSDARREGGKGL